MFRLLRRIFPPAISPPRIPASSGFILLDTSQKIEEEGWSWYTPSTFYSVRIGQLFQSRYQVLSKLGYGTSATVWLARDLMDHKYVALKVCISNYPSIPREKAAIKRLRAFSEIPIVQKCYDNFTIEGVNNAVHECFVLEPLSVSLATFSMKLRKWDLDLFRLTALQVLMSLKFLHTDAKLIHCDIRQENFLFSVQSDHVFRKLEALEAEHPSPRKIDGDRVVHSSPQVFFPTSYKNAVLCDFGEARRGDMSFDPYADIQPFPYRAPEVIFEIPFSYPADIWNTGVMLWHLFENAPLFSPFIDGKETDLVHVPQLVAALGLPPPSFLERSRNLQQIRERYFDAQGQYIGRRQVPTKGSLEAMETRLDGQDKVNFLRFIRRFLQWEPEKRANAAELYEDPWLNDVKL